MNFEMTLYIHGLINVAAREKVDTCAYHGSYLSSNASCRAI